MDERTEKAIHTILQASKNQPGNQPELLKLVTHLPTVTERFLPYPIDHSSAEIQEDEEVSEMIQTMAKGLTNLLKQAVHFDNSIDRDAKAQKISEVLESLILLGGCEFAKKKLLDVLSHEAYTLLQEGMDFVENLAENLETVEKNITYTVSRVKILALTTIKALFLCEQMKLTYEEQMNIVSSVILEKLSTELLMVVDSMKESLQLNTSSSNQPGYFLNQPHEDISVNSFFATSRLVSLANMIDCFLDLEKSLREYHLSTLQKTRTKSEQLKKSALKQRSKLPDILRSSQEASWIRSVNIYGDWDWQEVLKDIGSIIAKSISKAFDECEMRELTAARKSMSEEASNSYEMTESLSSSILRGSRIPKQSLPYFKAVLQLMKYLLPFAVLGRNYRPLCGLSSTYIDECNQILKTMKSFLSMALNDFPEKITITSLYSVLGTCEDACAVLGHCAFKIDSEPRMAFQGTLQSYQDMMKTIKSTITQNLSGRIRGCILHDADGDHFRDPKEYAEGESCSHSITNWRRFLDRLWRDLNCRTSESSRNDIFSQVFLSGLEVLELRYLRCEPSYNRKKQLLLDIPAIVSICREYTSNDHETSGPALAFNNDNMSHTILASCHKLQAVLCFVAGPLHIVEKTMSRSGRKDTNPVMPHRGSHSTMIFLDPSDSSSALAQCLHSLLRNRCSLLDCVLSQEFQNNLDQERRKSSQIGIYKILAKCSSIKPNAFFHCAYNSMGKNPQKLLENILPSSNESSIHPWQNIVSDQLGLVLCQSLMSAVVFLCHPTWSSLATNVIESEDLTKTVLNLSQANRTVNRDGHITASVILLIQGIEHALYLLPEWLITLLTLIQSELPNLSHVICGSVPVHVLILASRRFLEDPSLWDQFCEMEFTKEGVEAMQYVSKILASICHKNFKHVDGLDNMKLHLMNLCERVDAYVGTIQDTGFEYTDEQLLDECRSKIADFISEDDEVLNSLRKLKDVVLSSNSHVDSSSLLEQHFASSGGSYESHDWEKMCEKVLTTLDWESVKLLISHRWEMKEGASLNSAEAEIVEELKTKLDFL